MTGSILQLASVGSQDEYLTGNPQITNFKAIYKRHTNFTVESIELVHTGTKDFDEKLSFIIAKKGDLLSKMVLEIELIFRNQIIYERTGHAIIDYVNIEIGGVVIDTHYTNWLNVWSQLSHSKEQYTKLEHMIQGSKTDTSLFTENLYENNKNIIKKYYIPLNFWFNNNDGLALPLIALQYNEIKLNLKFKKKTKIFKKTSISDVIINDVKLFCDYIYLSTDERKKFLHESHEYLITQVQYLSIPVELFKGDNPVEYKLNFNHPCKELIWKMSYNDFFQDEIHYSLIGKTLINDYYVTFSTQNLIRPLVSGGIIMKVGQSLHSTTVGENGNLLNLINGTYKNVATYHSYSSGIGLTVDIIIAGGVITDAIVNNPGSGYSIPLVGSIPNTKVMIDITDMIYSGTPGFSIKALLDLRKVVNNPYFVGSGLDTGHTNIYNNSFKDWSLKDTSLRNNGSGISSNDKFNSVSNSSYVSFDNGETTETRDLRSPRLDLLNTKSIGIKYVIGTGTNGGELPNGGNNESLYIQFSNSVDWDNDTTFTTNIINTSNFTTLDRNLKGDPNSTIQIYKATTSIPSDSFREIEILVPEINKQTDQYLRLVQGSRNTITGSNYGIYDIQLNYNTHRIFTNNYSKYMTFDKVILYYNGIPRISERSSSYFDGVQSYQHRYGHFYKNSTNVNKPYKGELYCYSFALYPDRYQPSGTSNFSRIDHPVLKLNIKGSDYITHSLNASLDIFTVNYNILKIESGMASLIYSH